MTLAACSSHELGAFFLCSWFEEGGTGQARHPLISVQGFWLCLCEELTGAARQTLPLFGAAMAWFGSLWCSSLGHVPVGCVLTLGEQRVAVRRCVIFPPSPCPAGCKIKALRAKTNTYIKTPVRGEEPVFIVTGRKEDVEMAKREILSAAEHFSMIRATRNKVNGLTGALQGPPNLPGQTTIQVRVPYRVVGLVVGPKGATIKRIQQQTHTYIVTPSRDKEPVFEVTGMPENVDRAREEIEAHITMRTGSFIDVNADNDFHSNGTDVCLDLQGGAAAPWAKAPHPAQRPSAALRNDSLSSLGSGSTESFYSGRVAAASPTSPYSTFSEPPAPLGSDECDFGFDFLALDLTTPTTTIWSPFERSGNPLQAFSSCSSINSSQRRNSGPATPRHSPTSSDGHRKSSRECMVCLESEVMAALVPCGHNLFCMECALRICGRAQPQCPACHVPATQAIHIFS
uniref:Mex-3 RNA binding family member D n=1 Tax=Serinus canaria TaxID=9135 RepID=A0A8C9KUB2_SERCA